MQPAAQLEAIDRGERSGFTARLRDAGHHPLVAASVDILQLNILRQCNLACRHCHLESAPDRTERMSRAVMEDCVRVARRPEIVTIDITGGAPELHPDLPWLVEQLSECGKRVIVRTNLVILQQAQCRHLLDEYRKRKVELVGSLPDYNAGRTDRQRGAGTFDSCIRTLRDLNELGYGREGTRLMLHLVHNPAGAYLPASQGALEHEYRRQLRERHGVEFGQLFVLTNCPIGRFLEFLIRSENLEGYMKELTGAFNASVVPQVMCRSTLSVGWDGRLFDCDFNQVLELTVEPGAPQRISEYDLGRLASRRIVTRDHCFACCAGSGSSCQGALES